MPIGSIAKVVNIEVNTSHKQCRYHVNNFYIEEDANMHGCSFLQMIMLKYTKDEITNICHCSHCLKQS